MQPRASLLPALVSLVVLAGCASPDGPSGGEGTVAFAITDAPTDEFAKVEVTISRIAIHRSASGDNDPAGDDNGTDDGATASPGTTTTTSSSSMSSSTADPTTSDTVTDGGDTATLGSDGPSAGWVTLVDTPRTVDLIALHKNNTAETLGLATVEAGHYQQVRFYVDRVVGTYHNGTQVEMNVPSGVVRTGGSFTVEAGGNTTLTVEIDLDRSISCRPNGARAGDCTFRTHIGRIQATDED